MSIYFLRKTRLTAVLAGTALSVLLGAVSVAPAFADSATTNATITGGTLTETTSAAPAPSVSLTGLDQTVTYTLPLTVNDPTGTGNGWNVTITSTTLATSGATPRTFATTASTITGVTAACVANATCTDPTNSVTYPLTMPASATAPTAVKLFNAAANTGMGEFTITPTVSLAVPANTYAGTYTSTITLAIVSGP